MHKKNVKTLVVSLAWGLMLSCIGEIIQGGSGLAKSSIVGLCVFGSLGGIIACYVHGWFRAPSPLGTPIRSVVISALICLVMFCFGYYFWPSAAFIVLLPSDGLLNCSSRAFFVKREGKVAVYNVTATVRDKASGKSVTQQYDTVNSDDPKDQKPLFIVPSSPWVNEDYEITVSSKNSNASERIVLLSTNKELHVALGVWDKGGSSMENCRDHGVPDSFGIQSSAGCSTLDIVHLHDIDLAKISDSTLIHGFQNADGSTTITSMPKLPPPSDLDAQSDDRHLTEYQKQVVFPVVRRFAGHHMGVFFAGGTKSKEYANEFANLFRSARWKVDGPSFVPIGDEQIIDVQMSINDQANSDQDKVWASSIADIFTQAGIKKRSRFILDDAVLPGTLVLWIGPKSPSDVTPDMCSPVKLRPRGEAHLGCKMLAALDTCPIIH